MTGRVLAGLAAAIAAGAEVMGDFRRLEASGPSDLPRCRQP
jgi:hypothetical protein